MNSPVDPGASHAVLGADVPLAYVMSRFPLLTETFILREMVELVRRGRELAIVPLIEERAGARHAEVAALSPRVVHLGLARAQTARRLAGALRLEPRASVQAALDALAGNRASPKFFLRALVVIPKALALSELVLRRGATHLHAHYGTHSALLAWIVHRTTGASYSVTVHGHDLTVDRSMLARKLADAAFVIAPSEYHRRLVSAVAGDPVAARTHVVRCGIELERYRPSPASRDPRAKLEILSIGSLQPYKGFRILVAALALLRDRGVPFRCRVVGAGKEEAELRQRIDAAALGGVVDLLGARSQSEVAELLPTAHCYVQPSVVTPSGKTEGLPVALMEALACEVPVVASDVGGISELVQPGRTGALVPAADPAALATAIEAVARQWEVARQRARDGGALVRREFDVRVSVDRLEALFARA